MSVSEPQANGVERDPLHFGMALPHEGLFFPYGLPVLIKSNHRSVIDLAGNSWRSCQVRYAEDPVEIRILVSNISTDCRPPDPAFRGQGNLMTIVADAENYASCDLSSGFGFAVVTPEAVQDGEYLRYYFVEAMAYTLLDAMHLVMFHAASVAYAGKGFIFVGESGAGKSSLSYACARRGWRYISDDATAIMRRRSPHLALGNPASIRFRPCAVQLFPEIKGLVRQRNHKPTIEISTQSLAGVSTADCCMVSFILLLRRRNRAGEEPAILSTSTEAALQNLFFQSLPNELGIEMERVRAIESMVLGSHVFELIYDDPDRAVELLERLAKTT